MEQNHSGAIKGMGIAVIVLAALGIIGSIGGLLNLPGIIDSYTYLYTSYSTDNMIIFLGMMNVLFIMALVSGIVCLIAGIFCVKASGNPTKLGVAFGWSIAGAVVSFISGGLIPLILFIILAVFTYKDKKLA